MKGVISRRGERTSASESSATSTEMEWADGLPRRAYSRSAMSHEMGMLVSMKKGKVNTAADLLRRVVGRMESHSTKGGSRQDEHEHE